MDFIFWKLYFFRYADSDRQDKTSRSSNKRNEKFNSISDQSTSFAPFLFLLNLAEKCEEPVLTQRFQIKLQKCFYGKIK